MTIKARTAAAEMVAKLDAETDELRDHLKDSITFSQSTIVSLSEARDAQLKLLAAEFEQRRASCCRLYAEIIRTEERRIEASRETLRKLDGDTASSLADQEPAAAPIGHNSAKAEPSNVG